MFILLSTTSMKASEVSPILKLTQILGLTVIFANFRLVNKWAWGYQISQVSQSFFSHVSQLVNSVKFQSHQFSIISFIFQSQTFNFKSFKQLLVSSVYLSHLSQFSVRCVSFQSSVSVFSHLFQFSVISVNFQSVVSVFRHLCCFSVRDISFQSSVSIPAYLSIFSYIC